MESLAPVPTTMSTILCCICGLRIPPNPANMCMTCLSSRVDITDGIQKQLIMHQCRECHRYSRPPWVSCELESKELLALCLKKITGLNKVKLVDAGFVWTEPHSRRIKVKLTIQKEIDSGAKLQQSFVVEFVVQNQQCDDCQRSYTTHTWNSCVQVRQKVDHKKTFLYLEQVILKHNAHKSVIEIKQVPNGLDFFFGERSHAVRFCEFLVNVIPCKTGTARQLVSQDIQNGTSKYKHTFAVDIVPLCKDDLVLLPAKVAQAIGGISRVCIVHRVSTYVYLVDPLSLHTAELASEKFWRTPFTSLMPCSRMVEFTVLDVTPVPLTDKIVAAMARRKKEKRKGKKRAGGIGSEFVPSLAPVHEAASGVSKLRRKNSRGSAEELPVVPGGGAGGGAGGGVELPSAASVAGSALFSRATKTGKTGYSVTSTVTGGPRGKYLLAEVEVARSSDLGSNDTRYTVLSHLGNLLKAGDTVMGYDLSTAVLNDGEEGVEADLPEVVLVKKVYTRDPKKRNWKLKKLAVGAGGDGEEEGGGKAGKGSGAAARGAGGDDELDAKQMEDFLQDLEEDKALRSAVNIFKGAAKGGAGGDGDVDTGAGDDDSVGVVDADAPAVPEDELLDELTSAFGATGGVGEGEDDEDDEDDGDDEDGADL